MNLVRYLLRMRCMLLGNTFVPMFNSRVPNGTAGPVMIICLLINRRLQSKNHLVHSDKNLTTVPKHMKLV